MELDADEEVSDAPESSLTKLNFLGPGGGVLPASFVAVACVEALPDPRVVTDGEGNHTKVFQVFQYTVKGHEVKCFSDFFVNISKVSVHRVPSNFVK